MNKPFANKVALVTGAASGMGLAAAQAFAEAGAAVAKQVLMTFGRRAQWNYFRVALT
jgi:NADP-dependent 3-hydroxy acid dehydrogenase YdfG